MGKCKLGICQMCHETIEFPESIKELHKIEHDNWIAKFTYWSSENVQITTSLCRNCSLKVANYIIKISEENRR